MKEVPVYKSSISSTSTEEEKNHVIKVLEHESKVYNFEKAIMGVVSPVNGFKPKISFPNSNFQTGIYWKFDLELSIFFKAFILLL